MPTSMEAQSSSLSQHLVLHFHRMEARLINGVHKEDKVKKAPISNSVEGESTMSSLLKRKNNLTSVVVAAILALGAFTTGISVAHEQTLYERLGGYDGVSAVVDDFAGKLFSDPVVGARFFGMSDDSREGFRQKNKNLVCKVTGGPCKIISRSAAKTHGGLGIKASEFDIVAQHLVDTLNKFEVPEKEHKEFMAIIGTLRPDIVEVEDK